MKKIILIILCLFLCGCTNNDAKDAVKEYIYKFKNHDKEVLKSLEELISHEDLTGQASDEYRLVMKKQYYDLEYRIIEQIYSGNKATVITEITAYDYNKSKQEAKEYIEAHPEEFLKEDNTLDKVKYKNLQLKYMQEETSRVKYTVLFSAYYEQNEWHLENPDYTVLQKIHGIYEYEKTMRYSS